MVSSQVPESFSSPSQYAPVLGFPSLSADDYLKGRFLKAHRVNERPGRESRSPRRSSIDVSQHDDTRARRVLLSSLEERPALPG